VDVRDLGTYVGPPPGADVAAHLARREVGTRVERVTSGGSGIGELILAKPGRRVSTCW
jgi:hypothetical protein